MIGQISALAFHATLLSLLFGLGWFLAADPERDPGKPHPSGLVRVARRAWVTLVVLVGGALWLLSLGLCGFGSNSANCERSSNLAALALTTAYVVVPAVGERLCDRRRVGRELSSRGSPSAPRRHR